ncbi:MAG: helix-turn-helix transcriptional regulator [Chitinophagaceae bacterium]|nr:helix-turn-helix transcriptional regulator [Chitinophagaceae bacterium]
MLVRDVGLALKKRRKALKITQPHLAELAGISVNSLYKIERGEANPTLNLIEKVADVLWLEIKLEIKKLTCNY